MSALTPSSPAVTAANDTARAAQRRIPRPLAWLAIGLAWMLIVLIGACLALLIPVNLILVPCWLTVGMSLGALARNLLDG